MKLFQYKKEKIIYSINVLNEYIKEYNINTYYFIGPDSIKGLIHETKDYERPQYIIFCDFENIELDYVLFNKIFHYAKNGSKMITTSYSNYYISKMNIKWILEYL